MLQLTVVFDYVNLGTSKTIVEVQRTREKKVDVPLEQLWISNGIMKIVIFSLGLGAYGILELHNGLVLYLWTTMSEIATDYGTRKKCFRWRVGPANV